MLFKIPETLMLWLIQDPNKTILADEIRDFEVIAWYAIYAIIKMDDIWDKKEIRWKLCLSSVR